MKTNEKKEEESKKEKTEEKKGVEKNPDSTFEGINYFGQGPGAKEESL